MLKSKDLQTENLMLMMHSLKLTTYRGVLNRSFLKGVCFRPDTSPSLTQCLTFFYTRFVFLLNQIHLSEFFHVTFPVLSRSSLFLRWPDCSRALAQKKHSEIWCCITMPQTCIYHSTAAPLPHWNSIDHATIHDRCLL